MPPWAENVLQGIAYWIGHRRALYLHHYLTEGAIVAELANLMGAHLYDVDHGRQYLYCEIAYRNIAKRDTLGTVNESTCCWLRSRSGQPSNAVIILVHLLPAR